MIIFRKKLSFILVTQVLLSLVILSPGTVVSQSASQPDVSLEVERIFGRIQAGMNSSNEQIEQGNYDRAQDGTDTSIDSLSILLDLFMPLTERIKRIWEKEKEIVAQTDGLSKESARGLKANSAIIKKLVTAQQENIVWTRKAEDAIAQQLKRGSDSHTQNNQSRQPSQIDLLNRVGGLLKQAETHQGAAVDSLGGHEIKTALQSALMAEKKLKEALDAFQNHQQKNNQQQQNKQPSQNGSEKQSQKQKQDSQKDSREPNQNPGKSEAKSGGTPGSEKKMTPREALKELSRLRKEADAEKRRREKVGGKQTVPGRAPIEKDW